MVTRVMYLERNRNNCFYSKGSVSRVCQLWLKHDTFIFVGRKTTSVCVARLLHCPCHKALTRAQWVTEGVRHRPSFMPISCFVKYLSTVSCHCHTTSACL